MKKLFFILPIVLLADVDPFKAGLNSTNPYGLTPQEKAILQNKNFEIYFILKFTNFKSK